MKLSRYTGSASSSLTVRGSGMGLSKTRLMSAQGPKSRETISPIEHPLTRHPSPRTPDRRNLPAISPEENTGTTSSPDLKETRSTSRPHVLLRAITYGESSALSSTEVCTTSVIDLTPLLDLSQLKIIRSA